MKTGRERIRANKKKIKNKERINRTERYGNE